MKTLILDSNNIVSGSNNTKLIYQFPGGNIQLTAGQRLALSSITLYNSTPNITVTNNNTYFSYIWVDGTTNVVNIPPGNYDIPTLNTFFQSNMLNNGHYLVENSSGNLVYFLTLSVNATYYAVQIACYPISSTLYPINQNNNDGSGTGYSYGASSVNNTSPVWTIPTATILPIFVVPSTGFQQLVGLSAGNYPNATITNTNTVQTAGTGSQTGNVLTITGIATGLFAVNQVITTIPPTNTTGPPVILAQTSGTAGQAGTYTMANTDSFTSAANNTRFIGGNSYTQSPSYTTTQAFLSTFTPQVSPLSSYLMTCSLLNNKYAIPNTLLFSFPPKGVYGVQYEVAPYQLVWIDILPGQYNQMVITLTDQLGNPTQILDPNMTILIAISDPQDHTGFPLVK